MSRTVLRNNEWLEYSEKASEFLHNNKNKQVLEYYDKCFEALLRNKTTNPEIYRLFANKAITHLALGEEKKGISLLEMALKLNPNYDFGRDVLKRYEDGEYDNLMLRGSLQKLAENAKKIKDRKKRGKKFEKDPAIVYFNYLEKFNINFATKELTVSDITIIGPDGKIKKIKGKRKKVGRNDPCPCGSGRKYKKCCGK